MPNEIIHDEIEAWLAAEVHDQLSPAESATLAQHLAVCPACRGLQQEEKHMHQLLKNTLAQESADPAFEQRMVSRFRARIPSPNDGLLSFFSNLLRRRAAQLTAVAALLITLVQVGRMVTGEQAALPRRQSAIALTSPPARDEREASTDRIVATGANIPAGEVAQSKEDRASTNAFAAGKTEELKKDLADKEPAPADSMSALSARAKESDQPDNSAPTAAIQDASQAAAAPVPPVDARKLIRNAQLDLQVSSYDAAVQRLTTLAAEANGFVATQSSARLPNGKLQGTVVVKVAPDHLDRFLEKVRALGELKNQTLGTEDVTKAYFDTDARLRNAKRMEDRLLEMLKKNTGEVSDLLQVEKELARVREQIEQMQGELKYYDALVQYATVTITLAEKELNEPAAFLLRETANLSLFATDVEKTFAEVKTALQNAKAQIVQSTLDRDNSGQATARLSLLIAPEESDAVITRIKGMGRVQNFNVQTERVAQNGSGMSETAKVERDKVQLNLIISRTGEEPAMQQTSLRILTPSVSERVAQLKTAISRADGELRTSTFSRNPDGQEVANITLRVPMKNYAGLVASFDKLGQVKDLTVQRNDQPSTTANPETAPAEVSLQIYSPGKIVSDETGIVATIRQTLGQGAAAVLWSARMIGVALAFLAPWALALGLAGWLVLRFVRRKD